MFYCCKRDQTPWDFPFLLEKLRAGYRDFEKRGAVCRPPWLSDEENFRFQIVLKGQNNVTNYNFLVKHYFPYFQIFICKHFDKEREKTLIQQSRQKEKLRIVRVCFITVYLQSPLKWQLIINSAIGLFVHNFFFILQAPLQRSFCFLISGWRKKYQKGEIGHGKWLGMANYNIYFKNNYNRLVMKVTPVNFLNWQNVHIWRLIKVNPSSADIK